MKTIIKFLFWLAPEKHPVRYALRRAGWMPNGERLTAKTLSICG